MGYPKISYIPDGLSHAVELLFTYPPVKKSTLAQDIHDLEVERKDQVTLAGLKQSLYIRMDQFMPLQMDYVPMTDLDDWSAFMQHALAGRVFDYYPDRDIASFTTYVLEDKKWDPKYVMHDHVKFTLRMRKKVGSSVTS